MTPKFIPGAIYESTTHGLVEFKGVDRYMGQATLHFVSLKHGNCYWLPESLDMHFAPTPETEGCRYPMSGGRRCDQYPNCECGPSAETLTVPPGHFWRGEPESNRHQCRNCGEHYDKHLHTDEASTCPTAETRANGCPALVDSAPHEWILVGIASGPIKCRHCGEQR